MKPPVHLFDRWALLAKRLKRPERVALFSDFDGTLAPICSRPSEAWMPEGTRPLLSCCVERGVLGGIISGRRLADVRRRVGVPGLWYAGVHGYSVISPRNRLFQRLSSAERKRIAGVAARLSRTLRNVSGIRLERKEASVAVHYRGASSRSQAQAWREVRLLLAEPLHLRLLPGRKVWEILPAGTTSKASALRFVLQQIGSRPVTIFLGDDFSDEEVFGQIRGITVLVGRKRHTAARYWLRSPDEVQQFLRRCLLLWR